MKLVGTSPRRCRSAILGELDYVPLDKAGADQLFGFISQRYERRSLVVMTNLPFARRSEVFLDPAAVPSSSDRFGTLVVAGTQPGPGGEAPGGAEHARVGTHLTQDGAGRGVVDAGDGFQ